MANDGNGRWQGEWFAVPCNVGDTTLYYSIVVSSYYWFSMVVSNTRHAAQLHACSTIASLQCNFACLACPCYVPDSAQQIVDDVTSYKLSLFIEQTPLLHHLGTHAQRAHTVYVSISH